MTRDAKIGLLVGLCFITVIGILLSDAFHTNDRPPSANLAVAGNTVREGVNSPDSNRPAVSYVQPVDPQPRQSVPTREDLTPPRQPVQLGQPPAISYQQAPTPPAPTPLSNQRQPVAMDNVPAPAPAPENSLFQLAHQNGQDLVRIGPNGQPIATDPDVIVTQLPGTQTPSQTSTQTPSPTPAPNSHTQTPPVVATANRSYIAQPGDSVSKMAAHFLGSSTKTTRNLIVAANPTLLANPDRVVAGQTYIIPPTPTAPASPTPATPPLAPAPSTPAAPIAPPAPATDTQYTVQTGDNLWKIARDQLGDPHLVDAIKELNMDILRGDNHDTVVPGMKLTLPARAVAAAH